MSETRWLSIVGIGEDGAEGLSPAARRLVAQAALVVGGRRHLALAGPLAAETLVWPSPIEEALDAIEARRGEPVCVLASGDPFFFGVGAMLMRRFSPAEMISIPAPSAFALAASRLGWSQQDCALLSLHGRPLEAIIPHLQPGARILALSWDDATPAKLAALLAARGMGRSRSRSARRWAARASAFARCRAEGFALDDVAALNTDRARSRRRPRRAHPAARARPAGRVVRARRPDHQARHPRDHALRARAAARRTLVGRRRGLGLGRRSNGCWPIPPTAPSRSKPDHDRAARIARNALSLGVPALAVVTGEAPAALEDLPRPDAVFIGGGAGAPGVIERALAALPSGGRLVVNAVTLETQAACVGWRARCGGELVQIAVAHAEPVGRFTGWRAAMPIVQWRLTKP